MKRLILLLPLLLAHPPANADKMTTIHQTHNSEVLMMKNPITDYVEYGLLIDSKNSELNSINRLDTTGLLMACKESGIHAKFPTNTYNGRKDQYLTMRWEKEKPIKKKWLIHRGTGTSFAYMDGEELLKTMREKDSLLIMWETYSMESRYFIFDLKAARSSILKLQSACGSY